MPFPTPTIESALTTSAPGTCPDDTRSTVDWSSSVRVNMKLPT